jgi:hypothetical protein
MNEQLQRYAENMLSVCEVYTPVEPIHFDRIFNRDEFPSVV